MLEYDVIGDDLMMSLWSGVEWSKSGARCRVRWSKVERNVECCGAVEQ